jgi:hypothetical protein
MAGDALVVARPLEFDGAILDGWVAQGTLQAPELVGVKSVDVDFSVRSF